MSAARTAMWADFALSALHLGIIAGGAPAYRYFRAGEVFAASAEAGALRPALETFAIAGGLAGFGVIAAASAKPSRHQSLFRAGTGTIAAIFLARGAAILPQLAGVRVFTAGAPVQARDLAFSAGALVVGALHTVAAWRSTSPE